MLFNNLKKAFGGVIHHSGLFTLNLACRMLQEDQPVGQTCLIFIGKAPYDMRGPFVLIQRKHRPVLLNGSWRECCRADRDLRPLNGSDIVLSLTQPSVFLSLFPARLSR